MRATRPGPVIAWLLPLALVACAGVAAARGWWLSGAGALVAAVLLWRGHPRARFATYVLLTVVAVRAALAGSVVVVVLAVAAVLALQAPSARARWPRLRPGRLGARGDGARDDAARGGRIPQP